MVTPLHSYRTLVQRGLFLIPPLLLAGASLVLLFYALEPAPVLAVSSGDPFTSIWLSEESLANTVAWGDYDNDGDLDLATAGSPSRLYRNDGVASGVPVLTLQSWSPSGVGKSVAWGDYDNDGDLDLAVGNGNHLSTVGQPIRIYRNTSGAFSSTAAWTSAELDVTFSVAWGDYDKDGDLDLAAGNIGPFDTGCNCNPGSRTRVYQNNGGANPTFTLIYTSAQDNTAYSVAWGHYDNDNRIDLAVSNWNAPNRIYRNLTTTLSTYSVWTPTTTYQADSVAWQDVDKDGDMDLAVARYGGPNYVYTNTGTASGLRTAPAWSSAQSDTTAFLIWGDYDGDGDADLAAGNVNEPLRVYRNDTTLANLPTFSLAWSSPLLDGTSNIAFGDYDNDGDLDLAAGGDIGPMRMYRNNVNTMRDATSWLTPPISQTQAIAWGDYNRDGYLDLAVANDGQRVVVYNNSGGTLGNTPAWSSAQTYPATSLAWGDVDGDGDLDLAVGNYNQRNQLFLNTSGVLATTTAWTPTLSYSTQSIAWGDVDGDGDLDLAVGNFNQKLHVFRNDGGSLSTTPVFTSTETSQTNSVAWGDVDSDGDLDLALGNGSNFGQINRLYLNQGGVLSSTAAWQSDESDGTNSIAWGDVDGDGDLDLAAGNYAQAIRLYRNDNGALTTSAVWSSVEADPVSSLAWGDFDGDGDLDLAAATRGSRPNRIYRNEGGALTSGAIWTTQEAESSEAVAWGDVDRDGDLDLAVGNYSAPNRLYLNSRDNRANLGSIPTVRIDHPAGTNANFYVSPRVFDSGKVVISHTLSDPQRNPVREIRAYYSPNGGGEWFPAVAAAGTLTQNLSTCSFFLSVCIVPFRNYTYTWDVFASGFFGQSDNVVFRIEAVPAVVTGTGVSTPGPYLFGSYASQSFPFRVRGTQVRVISGTLPAAEALVYRMPAGETVGGALIADSAGKPFRTDGQGYLQGRGQLSVGDKLFALLPATRTESYTLYYTSGAPTVDGVSAFPVSASGVQTLTVSASRPLYLFGLNVALEWDASQDPTFLDQLRFNLHRASEYLYDFTNGQAALGDVFVTQNADDWAYAHVVVHATDRLRPFAAQGGLVLTPTVDPEHPDIVYTIGQVHIGSTWNRYGTPGTSLGDDWPIVLAHELSHYLFFQDDAYLGLDAQGNLIPVSTCKGSAMGDLYNDPTATEFIADNTYWLANCGSTLAAQTLGRNEWQTLQLWYPRLITPASVNAGPNLMPFDFTNISVTAPLTPTNALVDPTFYLNYVGGASSSSEARAFLTRTLGADSFLVDLGSPFGGQNRVLARGAQPGDRLCVFDRLRAQYGCEIIALGDDQVQLEQDPTWSPIIRVTPVTSLTLNLQVEISPALPVTLGVQARLYPDYGFAGPVISLARLGNVFSGTFTLADPTTGGNVQVWVDETALETNPRREAVAAFNLGGNPGAFRGGGGAFRGGGGAFRGGGGAFRGGGGAFRGGGAPVMSPDGQMIFFTEDPLVFGEGEFYTIQSMAGLPPLPPGRTVIGQGYNLFATPITLPMTGSVTIQYLSNDVQVAGADEAGLTLYFWTGSQWQELATTRNAYFNMATAASQGPGIYVLMASLQIPLPSAGWNLFAYPLQTAQTVTDGLASIKDNYALVYGYVATDTVDHWKVYSPNPSVPGWVNDLRLLEFGRGYWISATQPITIHLSTVQAIEDLGLPASPPDTYYGPVLPGLNFTPAAGMTIVARINGTACGQGTTQNIGGQIVYVVDVLADDGVANAGCGQAGRKITFYVNGRPMTPTAVWDNSQLNELALSPALLYLPLIRK